MEPQIQEIKEHQAKINTKISTCKHFIFKLQNNKEKILKEGGQ